MGRQRDLKKRLLGVKASSKHYRYQHNVDLSKYCIVSGMTKKKAKKKR